MPVLDIAEKIEKVFLPSTKTRNKRDENGAVVFGADKKPVKEVTPEVEQAYVVMDTSPFCAADTKGIKEDTQGGEIGILALAGRIRDWNFTDSDGKPIPINPATVGKLNAGDYGHLMSLLGGEDKLDPKASAPSSAASLQPATVSAP